MNRGETNDIAVEEMISKLKHLKNGKSPGPERVPNKLLKCGGEALAGQLAELFNGKTGD